MIRVPFLGLLQIIHNGPGRNDPLIHTFTSKTGEGPYAQLLFQEMPCPAFIKKFPPENFQAVGEKALVLGQVIPFKYQDFGRINPSQLIDQFIPIRDLRDTECPC